ncbi:MAG: branched-chain-amino-acid transaminase [Fimbriimonadaceae bacterium]|nr:Branched-chain-amino-acid aminotransferase [Fimbriimonadaceae bacterium]MCL4283827.1 branched-chain-amino-acid transaminase [Fimbriimonadaceae bacterium]QOJ12653.1 MAG: branched-chain-amino-acid transaminase [Chthonomonadaceae bacterium]
MPKLVWLNGAVQPLESARVSAADHAHLYGDGLFEGIRFYKRKVFKLDEHLERLYHGTSYMGYSMKVSVKELRSTILDVCKQADMEDGYIRLNVTRGTGLGLDPKSIPPEPNVMVMVSTLNLYPPELFETGLTVMTSPIRVIPPDSLDPRLKCIGRYASNILAKQYANRIGAGDGLMLNHQGYVAEGTGNNVFLVQKGVVRTPHPASGILKGITRDTVIGLAQEAGIEVREELLTPFDFYAADEGFFTGTATEVIPMISLDGNKIGCGRPGEVTLELMRRFRKATETGTAF